MNMRTFLVFALLGGVANARGDEAAEGRRVVDQAIRAHGGPENLGKMRVMQRKSSGTVFVFDQESAFEDELIVELPSRSRLKLELGLGAEKKQFQVVIDGDKGWQALGTNVEELPAGQSEQREALYVIWLATLLPLREGERFQLALLPEATVNGVAAVGIKVSSKGHADVQMYFDKQNRLLLKISRKASEAGITFDKEHLYGNYNLTGGVALPTKYTELNNGKKFVEATSISYRFLDRVDSGTFAKP
jgi:hypothetical protein